MKNVYLVLVAIVVALGAYGFLKLIPDKQEHLAFEQSDASLSELQSQLRSLAKSIKSTQGHSDCDFEDQCQIVGLGTPVCDLYKDFLIYSTKDANLLRLLPLIKKFNETHRQLSNLSALAEGCGVKPAQVHCVGGRCTAGR